MHLEKSFYLVSSALKILTFSGGSCPNCGSSDFKKIDEKYFVTSLCRCADCRLLYRRPTDSAGMNFRFYQKRYPLPDDEALRHLCETRFAGSELYYGYRIEVLRQLGVAPPARIFHYGCSWGYGSWQMRQTGYDVTSYEMSKPRAEFARRRVGVQMINVAVDVASDLRGSFDCFFSAHVLEEVPSPSGVVALARTLLRPNGLFVAFTPNGSASFQKAKPHAWHLLWGKVRPNVIDDDFYRHAFSGRPLHLDSTPFNSEYLRQFSETGKTNPCDLAGDELLCVAR
jgi:hypothetical protein